jgi:hypothetical protein
MSVSLSLSKMKKQKQNKAMNRGGILFLLGRVKRGRAHKGVGF